VSAVDYIVLSIVLVSAVISLFRGFVREVLSLAAWLVSFWVAISYTPKLASWLQPHMESEALRIGASFLALFITCLVLAALINRLVGQLVKHSGLSGTDRALGVVFGIIRGSLVVVLLVWLAGMTKLPQSDWWKQSLLLEQFERLALAINDSLPTQYGQYFAYQLPKRN